MTFLFIEVDGKTIQIPNLGNANGVKIIMRDDAGDCERHINVTHEGVIVDLVDHANGEVIDSMSTTHDEMLDALDV